MREQLSAHKNFLLYALIIATIVNFFIFDDASVILLFLVALCLYLSYKFNKQWLFLLALFFTVLTFFASLFFRIIILLGIMYYIYERYRTKHNEQDTITIAFAEDAIIQPNGITRNTLFSETQQQEHFAWRDITIQHFLGEVFIDTTKTVLPRGESFLSIRQGIGKVTIIVPYEVPFRISYTTLYGQAKILAHPIKKLTNETLYLREPVATEARRELVIHIATWFGDVEVKRQ